MAIVCIPRQLKQWVNCQDAVAVPGKNLLEVINNLIAQYPPVKPYLMDGNGKIGTFVSLYLNGKDVRLLQSYQPPLSTDDVITIVPAIAGG